MEYDKKLFKKIPVAVINSEDEKNSHSEDDKFDYSQSFDEAENVATIRSSKSAKKRTRRRPPEKYAEYAAYRGHTTSWAVLPKMEKQQLALRAFAESNDGTVKCLNEKCTKTLKNAEDIVSHVDKCLKLPEYFKYMGKADVFRALDKVTKAKILRVSMNALEILPCLNIETLNCTQKYGHQYALSYHLERCGQEKKRKSDKQKVASIAQGYLPEKSSRMKVADGVKRFKFKSTNLEASAPTPSELMQYQKTIDRANELLRAQREKESLCHVLVQFEHRPNNFKRIAPCDFSEDLNIMLNKCSIPLILPPGNSNERQPASSNKSRSTNVKNVQKDQRVDDRQRLPVFVPKPLHYKMKKVHFLSTENDIHEIGCVAYCGGPISTIKSCPRKLADG
ncbi:unnamed protein product [Onchocerca flexuosa]|uniref:SCA7 domain-containing protein n=1 Tax=Onchocerca flexuosa TaxID=387005 RepID=A0A183I2U3_9BILA|nr:unnamed protein product [Onchocerca flexuosa]